MLSKIVNMLKQKDKGSLIAGVFTVIFFLLYILPVIVLVFWSISIVFSGCSNKSSNTEESINILNNRMDSIVNAQKELKDNIDYLNDENDGLKKDNKELRNNNNELKDNMEDLEYDNNNLYYNDDQLFNENDDLQQQLNNMKSDKSHKKLHKK